MNKKPNINDWAKDTVLNSTIGEGGLRDVDAYGVILELRLIGPDLCCASFFMLSVL